MNSLHLKITRRSCPRVIFHTMPVLGCQFFCHVLAWLLFRKEMKAYVEGWTHGGDRYREEHTG
jgi:hypothetical protein